MNLNSNSLFASYYKWMFRGVLPNDFCSLFWNTLISIPLLVLTVPTYLASLLFDSDLWDAPLVNKALRGIVVYFGLVLIFFFGLAFFEKMFGRIWTDWSVLTVLMAALFGFAVLALTVVTGILAIVGTCFGIHSLTKAIKNSFRKKVTFKAITEDGDEYEDHYYEAKEFGILIMWNTIRYKYCSKINWK